MEHLTLHQKQREIVASQARFKTVRAGRKGGKTALEVEVIAFKAVASVKKLGIKKDKFATGRKVLYIAPTQDQARKIVWEYLKRRLAGVGKPNEQMLEMKVANEDGEYSTIYVGGWENRENYRGLTDVIHITFDELDTLKNFFVAWKEIFRPMFLDTGGSADFIGTPKKENPNLKRLERDFQERREDFASFHFTSKDNPHLPIEELKAIEDEYQDDRVSYQQEILAEYVENQGALFSYTCLLDVFTNSVSKRGSKYLIVDVADDGTDKTIFSFWEDLEEYRREEFTRMNTEGIVSQIREYAAQDQIPYSNIAVDAIGVGAAVASSSLLDGIIGFKGSYQAIKTDQDIVHLPNISYLTSARLTTDYANLRSQCLFTLAQLVNNHKVASRVQGEFREMIIEELSTYQDASKGDGKRRAMGKDEVKVAIGRSPDHSDTWQMRMYFEIMSRILPEQSEETSRVASEQRRIFKKNRENQINNSTR